MVERHTTRRGAIREARTESGETFGPGEELDAARRRVRAAAVVAPHAAAPPDGAATLGRSAAFALLPLACAVHCMLTPLVVALVPALDVAPSVEWGLLGMSVAVAILALRRGGRLHRSAHARALAGAGAGIWALSLLGVFEPLPETVTSPIGGVALAAGLFWNGRLSHRHACRDCGCPMH